jgi:hypothetical protein
MRYRKVIDHHVIHVLSVTFKGKKAHKTKNKKNVKNTILDMRNVPSVSYIKINIKNLLFFSFLFFFFSFIFFSFLLLLAARLSIFEKSNEIKMVSFGMFFIFVLKYDLYDSKTWNVESPWFLANKSVFLSPTLIEQC